MEVLGVRIYTYVYTYIYIYINIYDHIEYYEFKMPSAILTTCYCSSRIH